MSPDSRSARRSGRTPPHGARTWSRRWWRWEWTSTAPPPAPVPTTSRSATARQRGNRRATRQLQAIGPPPHLTSRQFTTRVRWATNFGGVTTGETYATLARGLLASLVRSPDYPAADVIRTVRGISTTQAALLPELAALDLARTVPRLDVPVVMVQGRHDQVAPGAAAQRYASTLQAPGKQPDVVRQLRAHAPSGRTRQVPGPPPRNPGANDAAGRHLRQRAATTDAAMNGARSWMLYGAAGHTGTLIARHARQRGHRPLLAGRNAPATAALAEDLDLPCLALALDDPAVLNAALADVDLVLNAAGPFLHTAAPLAQACLAAGVHYIDIGNEACRTPGLPVIRVGASHRPGRRHRRSVAANRRVLRLHRRRQHPRRRGNPHPIRARSVQPPPRRSAPTSPSPSRTPPGSTPSPQKPLPAVLENEVTRTTCRQRRRTHEHASEPYDARQPSQLRTSPGRLRAASARRDDRPSSPV